MITGNVDEVFALSLLGGLVLSLLAGVVGARTFGRLRLPRIFPRLRAPTKVGRRFPASWLVPAWAGLLVTLFGASGLGLRHFAHLTPLASVVGASIIAVVVSSLATWATAAFFSDTARELPTTPLLTTIGHLSVAIPEDGVGAIAFVADGKRVTMPAHSKDGAPLEKGSRVVIIDRVGKAALVKLI